MTRCSGRHPGHLSPVSRLASTATGFAHRLQQGVAAAALRPIRRQARWRPPTARDSGTGRASSSARPSSTAPCGPAPRLQSATAWPLDAASQPHGLRRSGAQIAPTLRAAPLRVAVLGARSGRRRRPEFGLRASSGSRAPAGGAPAPRPHTTHTAARRRGRGRLPRRSRGAAERSEGSLDAGEHGGSLSAPRGRPATGRGLDSVLLRAGAAARARRRGGPPPWRRAQQAEATACSDANPPAVSRREPRVCRPCSGWEAPRARLVRLPRAAITPPRPGSSAPKSPSAKGRLR